MCGIIGYSGAQNAGDVILAALTSLEYRGYDSAGMAFWRNGKIETIKCGGRLENLRKKCAGVVSCCGIGHTRWATHGAPGALNAHPHTCGRVTLVHNGIIENYRELREELEAAGYSFISETDTEIAACLIDFYYRTLPPLEAIHAADGRMQGSYALAILFAGEEGSVYGIRRGSPLVAARDATGAYLASDVAALLPYTRDYYLLEEGETVRLDASGPEFYDADLKPLAKSLLHANWSVEQAQKGGWPNFMLKEIYEQPQVLGETVAPRIADGLVSFADDGLPEGFFRGLSRLHITACGTALYSGMVGKALIEGLARLPVEVEVASELRYRDPILLPGEAAVVISQSGETADTLAALRLFKQRGIPVVGVVNVVGSSIAREADHCLYIYAGPEIAVASTKAYSAMVAMMYLIAGRAALERGTMTQEGCRELTRGLRDAIARTPEVLAMRERIERSAAALKDARSAFYIGRGLDYSLALEGSLKLKEISYIHSEAYPAGELKHGTISLITEGVPVIALATQRGLFAKTMNNVREVKARGGRVLLITVPDAVPERSAYDDLLCIPGVPDLFTPILLVIILQLIGACSAMQRGCDVDKPRNLAKSVTVE